MPASRIIGGYTVKDGVIVPTLQPQRNHRSGVPPHPRDGGSDDGGQAAVRGRAGHPLPARPFPRRRASTPGSPRYELGLQRKEDALHRLVDIWATGEAGASLGFAAARLFDELDPLERQKDAIFAAQGIEGGRGAVRVPCESRKGRARIPQAEPRPEDQRDGTRYEALQATPLVRYVVLDALANVLCPACKLWNTGHGANMMREAVSLMGGYGITEDCPGFLGQKWMDAQLEATYEGPEAVQRRQLSVTMTNELFLAQFEQWIERWPGSPQTGRAPGPAPWHGHATLAMDLPAPPERHRRGGRKLYHSNRQGVTFPLADALCWLLAAGQLILDVLELEAKGPPTPRWRKVCRVCSLLHRSGHVQSARAAGEVGRICAELVFGYKPHPAWDEGSCATCYSGAAGPNPCLTGLEAFVRLRAKLYGA